MENIVGWFEIYVNDMARAKKFYETVFDVQLTSMMSEQSSTQFQENCDTAVEMQMYGFPSNQTSYGASGALVQMTGFEAGKNSVLIYFKCQDCAVEAQRAVAAGGRVIKEKFSINAYGFIAIITDSEGNMIGLHSMS